MESIKEREYLFDNLKAFTLFCVALGHTLDVFIVSQDSGFRYLMQYMYLFNMPLFAFVTGYFSKNVEKCRETAVRKVLVPYVVLQAAYVLMAVSMIALGLASYNADVFQPTILLPTSPLYYLLSVFLWKLLVKDMVKLRFPMILAVIAGVLVSLMPNQGFHVSYGSALTLLVFFLAGYYCTREHIEKIRRIPKGVGLLVLVLGIIPATVLPYSFRNVRYTYEQAGVSPAMGCLYRLLFYVIAFLMIFALINVMSPKKRFFSQIGVNSILVYAASSFLAPHGYVLITAVIPQLTENAAVNLVGMLLFSGILVWVASRNWVKMIYDAVMGWIDRMLFRQA